MVSMMSILTATLICAQSGWPSKPLSTVEVSNRVQFGIVRPASALREQITCRIVWVPDSFSGERGKGFQALSMVFKIGGENVVLIQMPNLDVHGESYSREQLSSIVGNGFFRELNLGKYGSRSYDSNETASWVLLSLKPLDQKIAVKPWN